MRSRSSQPTTHHCSATSAYASVLKPRIKQKLSKLSSFFFAQRNRVLDHLEHLTNANSNHLSTLNSEPSTSTEHLLFDPAEETKLLSQKLLPLIRSDLDFGVTMVGREVSASDLALPPQQVSAFLAQREIKFREVNQTTLKELSSSVLEGLRNGEPFNLMADRVKAIYQDASGRRAALIAGNETNSAVNAGRFLGMKAASVERKGWQTADDEKVRPAHAQAEGDYAKGIPIDQPFTVGGEELMYPGDANGSIGNVINCRCYSFPILGDEQP